MIPEPEDRPLIIISQDPILQELVDAYNVDNDEFRKAEEELEKEHHKLTKAFERKHKHHWELMTKRLIESGLVDSPDVSLSVRNGVMYLNAHRGEETIEHLAKMLKKMGILKKLD